MSESRTLSVAAFVARYEQLVPGASSPLWTEQRTHIPAALAAGDWPWIAALYDSLESRCPPALHIIRRDALFALALVRDPRSLDAFISRARRAPPWGNGFDRTGRGWARKLGALLGYGITVEQLEYLTETYGDCADLRDMLACATQELVSFDDPVGDSALVSRFWRKISEEGHELASLPLSLLDVEKGLRRRWRTPEPDLLGNWFSFAHVFTTYGAENQLALAAPAAEDELPLDASLATQIAGGLCDSMSFPNGTHEVRTFAIREHRAAASVRGLPLACLQSEPEPIVELARTARETLGSLWALFTQGGAYAEGRSAAHGRALAWASLAGLCDARDAHDIAAIFASAESSWFTAFSSKSPWFSHVCVDVGITCTRRDGRSLAVFAATDSD